MSIVPCGSPQPAYARGTQAAPSTSPSGGAAISPSEFFAAVEERQASESPYLSRIYGIGIKPIENVSAALQAEQRESTVCPVCGSPKKQGRLYCSHPCRQVAWSHRQHNDFICSECGQGFISQRGLTIHRVRHHGWPETSRRGTC